MMVRICNVPLAVTEPALLAELFGTASDIQILDTKSINRSKGYSVNIQFKNPIEIKRLKALDFYYIKPHRIRVFSIRKKRLSDLDHTQIYA